MPLELTPALVPARLQLAGQVVKSTGSELPANTVCPARTQGQDALPANTKAASAEKHKLEPWPKKPAAAQRRGAVLPACCRNWES